MIAVWQKIKADILHRPVISLLVLLTVATSATLLTLALATLLNLSAPYDRTFGELNAAHVWLFFDESRVGAYDIDRVADMRGVEQSTGLRYSVPSTVRIGDSRAWVSLRALPPESPEVNRLLIQQGRSLSQDRSELLGSKDLNYLYDLTVGESVEIIRPDGKEVSLPVVGLAYNPMWDIYRSSQPPYMYLHEETLREIYPDRSQWEWSIGLRLANPESVDEQVKRIHHLVGEEAIESYVDWRDVRRSAMFEVQLNLVFLGAFSFFAMVATVLVIATSISSIVLSQFRQIGILKAVGFTPGQILSLYIGQYAILGLIGGLMGLTVGGLLSPYALTTAAVSLSRSFRPPLTPSLILSAIGAILTIITLSTVGAAFKGAKANIVRSIAVGAEAPRQESSSGRKLAEMLNLPMVITLGLNEVFAKPLRSLLTGLNLTLGVIGIVFGLTLSRTLTAYGERPALIGIPYDAVVTRANYSDSKTQHILSQMPGIEAFYGEVVMEVNTIDDQSFHIRAVEGNLSAFPFKIDQGQLLKPGTDEAIAGRGLMNWLDLEIGDRITVTLEEREKRPISWQIVGLYPESSNAGQMLTVNLSTLEQVSRHAEPETYYIELSSGVRQETIKRWISPSAEADLDITFVGQVIPDDYHYLQTAIFALSGILIGVALINVFTTSLLAVREKVRRLGILKAVGMTPAQVVLMVNTTAGFLGLLAALVGIPLGILFTQQLLNALSGIYGFGEVSVTLGVAYAVLLAPLTVLVSTVGSIWPSRWAAKLPAVSVLRSE